MTISAKYSIIKDRSTEARKRIVDSCMSISNKIWEYIFLSFLILPIAAATSLAFSEKAKSFTEIISNGSIGWFLIIYGCACGLGAFFAVKFRKYALDIADSLISPEKK